MLYRNTNGIPRETVMHVARRLHEHGMRQADIAQQLSCSQSTISAWLKEVRLRTDYVAEEQVESLTRSILQNET